MMRIALAAAVAAGLAAGCSSTPSQMTAPTEVSGTVTAADGRPVKDVQLVLRPVGEGHPATVVLPADGKFKVTVVPGEFLFLFEPVGDGKMDRAKAKAAFAAVPAKFQDVSMDNKIRLAAGGGNEIKLAN